MTSFAKLAVKDWIDLFNELTAWKKTRTAQWKLGTAQNMPSQTFLPSLQLQNNSQIYRCIEGVPLSSKI